MLKDRFVLRGAKRVIKKTPAARLDYVFDFTDWLAANGDQLSTATATATGGLTVEAVTTDGGRVSVWLHGGDVTPPGGPYASATCRITTVEGRQDDRTAHFRVMQR